MFEFCETLLEVFYGCSQFLAGGAHGEGILHPLLDILAEIRAAVGRKLLIDLAVEAVAELVHEVVDQPHVKLRHEPIYQLQPVRVH